MLSHEHLYTRCKLCSVPFNGVINIFNATNHTEMLRLLDRNWSRRLPISTFYRKLSPILLYRSIPRKYIYTQLTSIIISILIWLISSQRLLLHHDIATSVASIMAVLVMVAFVISRIFKIASDAFFIHHGRVHRLFQDLVPVRKLFALDVLKIDIYFGIFQSVIVMSKNFKYFVYLGYSAAYFL